MRRDRIVLGGAIMVLVGLAIWSNSWRDNNNVHSVQVEGVSYTDKSTLMPLIEVEAGVTPVSNIVPNAIAATLTQHPAVKAAVVAVGVDGTLLVNIEERKPLALVFSEGEAGYYTDAEGAIIPVEVYSHKPDVPLLYMKDTLSEAKAVSLSSVVSLLETFQTHYIAEYRELSEVHLTADNNLYCLLLNGTRLVLGNVSAQETALEALPAAIASFGNPGKTAPLYVDLRWRGQIVVREQRATGRNS